MPCQVLLWMSGLRGAIAFVLALSVPDLGGSKSGTHNRNLIITTTLAIIVFTTVALGSLIEFFALRFNIIRRVEENEGFSSRSSITAQSAENEEWGKAIIEGCKQLWHSLKHSPYRKHTSPLLSNFDAGSKSRRRCRCNSASPPDAFS
ncbi:putative sodium/hydrogen exchanger [Gregarina niphandrodes]|uniref:Sodium/hydrogen exchanger n=1 Tax=Gregarina niphandrodes TaxID=110365 RepID=A0A023AZV8_GRENI|nr:putative sodium/hydrogen exchanger [Gregarina niphandrodes]EZG44126.1 putative sodium/hydrogen exchanger [Gregarina niphandrodes]|eukprot:XP_011132795.1 putative sodium/hydrogen exchanger [Gregarina niphandrodes]